MQEAERRNTEGEPGQEHLHDEEAERDQAPLDAASPGDERQDHENQRGGNEQVAESDVRPKPAPERVVGDRLVLVRLIRRVEGADSGKPDLNDNTKPSGWPRTCTPQTCSPPGCLTDRP